MDKLLQKHFSEQWHEMDSLVFYQDTLEGVSNNLGENNTNFNEEDTNDPEEQCQPSAEGDIGDQLIA